jgi:drug/metabolite transporter (DMT)-like permease
VASLLWSFSFGLIKETLAGYDPLLVAFLRLAISAAAFLPWLVRSRLAPGLAGRAAALGALQFGTMYALYIASYRYLPAYGVAFFTIFTPLYVVLLDDLARRRWVSRHLLAALLAVGGAGLVLASGVTGAGALTGIVLLQGANLCFAAGQLGYRHLVRGVAVARPPEAALLGWMYLGSVAWTGPLALVLGRGAAPQGGGAWLVLLYLGLVPTGLGFYLWNKGAARVPAGALAVCNNLKIPLAVLVAWLVFGEQAAYARLLAGLAIIVAALFVANGRSPVTESGRLGEGGN